MYQKLKGLLSPKFLRRILGYGFGLSVLGAIAYLGGLNSVKATYQPLIFPIILCFVSTGLLFFVSAARWGFIVNKFTGKRACTYFDYFFYLLSSRFFGQYISYAGGDLLVRPSLLKKRNEIAFKIGVSTVILDKSFDLFFVLLLIGPAILYLSGIMELYGILVVVIILFAATFMFLTVKNSLFRKWLKKILLTGHRLLTKLPTFDRHVGKYILIGIENIGDYEVLKGHSLIIILILSVIRYFMLVLRLYFLSIALELTIPMPILFVGIPTAQLSLMFSVTPGALGVLEGGWYAVFAIAGISQADRVTFLVGQRAYWFIFTSVIFFASYLIFVAKRFVIMRKRDAVNGQEKDTEEKT